MLTYARHTIVAARALERALSWMAPWLAPARPPRAIEATDAGTIVLIEPFQLGDVLSLAVLLDPLRKRFPGCRILVWCHTRNAHVYAGDARVASVVHAPFPWSNRGSKRGTWADWVQVARSVLAMRAERPEIAIDPRGDIRSQALMLLAGSGCRIGFTTYVGSNLRLRGLLLSHALGAPRAEHRYLANLETLTPLLGVAPPLRLPAWRAHPAAEEAGRTGRTGRTILIHPGSGWAFRQWPQARWAKLIDRLRAGCGDSVAIRLIGGPGEAAICAEVAALSHAPIETLAVDFAGLMRAISGAALLIGLDSGPMNAAAVSNVPALALFGPGEPARWRPLSAGSRYLQRVAGYPCHPCNQTACVRGDDPCMRAISVDEVFAAAMEMLAGRARLSFRTPDRSKPAPPAGTGCVPAPDAPPECASSSPTAR